VSADAGMTQALLPCADNAPQDASNEILLRYFTVCCTDFFRIIMPKMKSSGSAKKRFSLTGTGRIRRRRGFHRHILMGKSPKRRRTQRQSALVSVADEPRIKQLLAIG
jgi:large subunit ribosomal protein L35